MTNRIVDFISRMKDKIGRSPTVTLLGFGKTNRAVFDILSGHFSDLHISVRSESAYTSGLEALPRSISPIFGDGAFRCICEDIIFPSPSVRRDRLIFRGGAHIVTSDTELFFENTPENTFLITGSSGKSTVTAMTAALLGERFTDIFEGGNLGTPVALADTSRHDAYALELSSFSLMYVSPRSRRAAVTNISENHLNWHKGYDEYIASKLRILEHTDERVVSADEPLLADYLCGAFAVTSLREGSAELLRKYRPSHTVTRDKAEICLDGKPVADIQSMPAAGEHNIANFMTAVAMSAELADAEHVRRTAEGFKGLKHRCERFLTVEGIGYIDSSIDTTPARTAATLAAMDKSVSIILGGRGKGLDLAPIRYPLCERAVKIALYGEEGERIAAFIEADRELSKIPHKLFRLFRDAVIYACEDISEGTDALLSPAAASYGEFSSFEERGAAFKKIVYDITDGK